MVKKTLDSVDLKILRILQDEGRISNLDLSKKISMSPPPTLRRVRDLEDNGYIDGFRANLDPTKLGYDLTAWIFISLKNQNEESLSSFEKQIWGWESIRECFMLNGEIDFILKCVAPDLSAFQSFLTGHLTSAENVASVKTSLVIRCAKDKPGVPFEILEERILKDF